MTSRNRMEKNPKSIVITNADKAPLIVMQWPNRYYVVSLRGPNQVEPSPIDGAQQFCRGLLVRKFDDVSAPSPHWTVPTEEDIRTILEWSKGKHNILVHCHQGISRSSATAYLIACTRMSPKKALEILDKRWHWPNPLIIKHGAKILNNPEIETALEGWRNSVRSENVFSMPESEFQSEKAEKDVLEGMSDDVMYELLSMVNETAEQEEKCEFSR